MQYPNIKYIITSQFFEKTKSYELLLAIPDDNDEYKAIIITRGDGNYELDGSSITFTDQSLTYEGSEYMFNDLAIAFENINCYLILESNNNKIWNLPHNVTSFLKMDIINYHYAITIINKEPHIIEIAIRNTWGQNQTINLDKSIILSENTEFHYNETDSLNSSYFTKFNSKYYITRCYLHKDKEAGKIGVYSDSKISAHYSYLLGFININL